MTRRLWAILVRDAYIDSRQGNNQGADDNAGAEFDAWLEYVKQEARAEALEEAADQYPQTGLVAARGYLRDRATAIRQEGNR